MNADYLVFKVTYLKYFLCGIWCRYTIGCALFITLLWLDIHFLYLVGVRRSIPGILLISCLSLQLFLLTETVQWISFNLFFFSLCVWTWWGEMILYHRCGPVVCLTVYIFICGIKTLKAIDSLRSWACPKGFQDNFRGSSTCHRCCSLTVKATAVWGFNSHWWWRNRQGCWKSITVACQGHTVNAVHCALWGPRGAYLSPLSLWRREGVWCCPPFSGCLCYTVEKPEQTTKVPLSVRVFWGWWLKVSHTL